MSNRSKEKKAQLDTPEFVHWRAHRKFILGVERGEVGFRGAAALGLCIEDSGNWITTGRQVESEEPTFYVPDADVTWLTLQDLPIGHWITAMNREVHLATVRRTAQRFGMPSLRWSDLLAVYDFRLLPSVGRAVRPEWLPYRVPSECLNARELQHFRAFNAMNWALTSTAVHFRSAWRGQKKPFYEMLGLPYAKDKTTLLFGEGTFNTVEQPFHWAPRPILGFQAQIRKHLFERSIHNANGTREFTDDFRWEFIRALEAGMPIVAHHDGKILEVRRNQEWHGMPVVHLMVRYAGSQKPCSIIVRTEVLVDQMGKFQRGDVLGYDGPKLPKHWKTLPPSRKWTEAQLLFKSNFLNVMHLWFDRQVSDLKENYVHVPAALASKAAMGSAVESELYWDVTRAMPYYNPACDALIFPTLRLTGWDDFRIPVGELDLDLTPHDSRFKHGRKPARWQPLDREQRRLQQEMNVAEKAKRRQPVKAAS